MAIAAAEDERVLVLTVDPARRLATALGIKGIGASRYGFPRRVCAGPGSPDRRSRGGDARDEAGVGPDDRALLAGPRDGATILRNPLYQRITELFVGSHEYAAIEALYELHDAGEYDCIVVDTPPSRSALDFLEVRAG